jgi:hypothetical protein
VRKRRRRTPSQNLYLHTMIPRRNFQRRGIEKKKIVAAGKKRVFNYSRSNLQKNVLLCLLATDIKAMILGMPVTNCVQPAASLVLHSTSPSQLLSFVFCKVSERKRKSLPYLAISHAYCRSLTCNRIRLRPSYLHIPKTCISSSLSQTFSHHHHHHHVL